MKDRQQGDRPAAGGTQQTGREAQPWHAADERKPPSKQRGGGAPIGTHSLTGGSAQVGVPEPPHARERAERSAPRDTPPGAQGPDPLAEPRADIGEILGRKP